MVHAGRSDPRARYEAAAVAGAGVAACVAAALAACITTPPPDLPYATPQAPRIEHDAVVPPADVPLVEWPDGGEFTIPVQVSVPGETFVYQVFYDFGTVDQLATQPSSTQVVPSGGVEVVVIDLLHPDPRVCPHRIDFVVANQFQAPHVPDSVGGDIVSWFYTAGGGPNGCPSFDAGTGAFPEASTDASLGGDP